MNPRPTPGTTNAYAEAMRQVPSYEPRCVVANVPSRMQDIVTDVQFSPGADACACPGDPTFFSPGTLAQIDNSDLIGRRDTKQRAVSAVGIPPILTMGRMHHFLGALGQNDFLDTTGDLQDTPFLPTDTIDITSFPITGDLQAPPTPLFPIIPSGPSEQSILETTSTPITGELQAPPTTTIPVLNITQPSPTVNPTSTAITGATNVATQITKALSSQPTPGSTAMTAAQIAAANAAKNPLNQSVGIAGLTVGNLLLIAGVLVGGVVLISQTK